jgi:hypothetical protein
MKRFGLHFSAVLFCEIQGFHDGEDGGSMFLRNVGIYLQVHKALLHRRLTWKVLRYWRLHKANMWNGFTLQSILLRLKTFSEINDIQNFTSIYSFRIKC